jgi:hypothetical protein
MIESIHTEDPRIAQMLATMVLVQQTDLKDPQRIALAYKTIYKAITEAIREG